MGKINVITLFLLLTLSYKFTVSHMRKPMILDVIQNHKGNVVAKLCWPMVERFGLATELIKAKNPRSVQFINNFNSIEKFIGEDMIIIFDLNCLDNHLDFDSQILIKEADINIFEKPFTWLILPNAENSAIEMISEEIQNLSIFINSEVIIAHMKENNYILQLIYKIDSTSEMMTEFYGDWTPSNGLNVSEDAKMTTVLRRKNLNGKTITMSVVVTHEETKSEIYNMDRIKTDVYAKYTFINIGPLYDFMNATQKLIFTDTWGYPINRTTKGMVGHLIRGEADLCGTMILMTTERREMINYLTTTFPIRAAFVFLAPPLSLQNNLFVLPFKNTVWACVGALIVLFMIVIYINASWERTKGGMMAEDHTTVHPNASDVTMYIASAITQQGSSSGLKGSLGRVVTFIMLLSFLFLYTSYSASIVALLQSTSDQIRTLTDLLNSKLELGVEDQPYNRHFFTKASDRVRKLIYENKVARVGYKPNFMDISEGVKKIQTSTTPFAFHMDLGHGYKIVNKHFQEHEKCGLREIEYLPKGRTWFCARKKSLYGEIYKLGLVRITEHGLSDRLNSQVQARKPPCLTSGGTVASVNMVDFRPVLLCWLYGAVAAVIVLLVEIIVHRRRERAAF